MRTLRPWIYAVLAIPVVTVLVAFVLAQSQLIRLVGRADWTMLLWPNLEWLLGAALIAGAYRRDWPRWSWDSMARMGREAVGALAILVLLLWATGTAIAVGAWDWHALLPMVSIAPALLVWCIAEETVLRGVAGRLSAAVRPLLQPMVLLAVAGVNAVLLYPVTAGLVLVSVCALEALSIVGYLAGNPIAILAARRWVVRLLILAFGIPGVGFAVRITPLAQLAVVTPILGVLLVCSLCVLWSCLIAILWTRASAVHALMQQNSDPDV